MQQYESYEFMFALEYDVRLVGHWGRFFDASMQQAQLVHGHHLQADKHLSELDFKATDNTAPGPADLIVYSQLGWGDKWKDSIFGLNMTDSWEAFIMVGRPASPALMQT